MWLFVSSYLVSSTRRSEHHQQIGMEAGLIIDIGIFAHNEERTLPDMLSELIRQSIFEEPDCDIVVNILANGCSDNTVSLAQAFSAAHSNINLVVHDDPQGGKSRTWNRFVHEISRQEASLLMFCDADISLPERHALIGLVNHISGSPGVQASSSRPVKDIQCNKPKSGLVLKAIAAAGGGLDDWKTAICGQLYVARADCLRGIFMPVGLPVEDGFLRAMIMTDLMQRKENRTKVSAPADVFHVYETERSIQTLIKHQVRIVIGSSINKQVFDVLNESRNPSVVLENASRDPTWLFKCLKQRLPTSSGWVSTHFLFKRLQRWQRSPSIKKLPITLLGFCFDAVVYVIAQVKMARGTGVGHW